MFSYYAFQRQAQFTIRGILCFILAAAVGGCREKRTDDITLEFALGGGSFTQALNSRRAHMAHLNFYIYDIYLIDSNDQRIPYIITNTSPWQRNDVALLSFANADLKESNTRVHGTLPSNRPTIVGLGFSLGLPFDVNHTNPLTTQSPLNIGSLYWSWQLGYKFLRVDYDYINALGTTQQRAFHLGSTGCLSASAIRPPQQACEKPNIAHIELRGFSPKKNVITVNMDALLHHDQNINATPAVMCTGHYKSHALCEAFISTLGLSADSGQCENNCLQQQLFVVGERSQ
ncbi:MAG: putative repeat protein (TIGR04052 family) [Lentisphaeria bacterium]|jgi:uncharacterized repeat protein (TIGR04052 family)